MRFAIRGKGRCEGATAFVEAEGEDEAVARLTRDDACLYFEVADVRVAWVEQDNG